MDIKIIIKRQKDSRSAPYTQEFIYTGDGRLTVADFLSELNTRTPLLTADGKETEKSITPPAVRKRNAAPAPCSSTAFPVWHAPSSSAIS